MDNHHLYASVAELQREIDDDDIDPHRKAAAAMFELPPSQVTVEERWWGKAMNMMAVTGTGPDRLARDFREPVRLIQDMADRYRRVVLA